VLKPKPGTGNSKAYRITSCEIIARVRYLVRQMSLEELDSKHKSQLEWGLPSGLPLGPTRGAALAQIKQCCPFPAGPAAMAASRALCAALLVLASACSAFAFSEDAPSDQRVLVLLDDLAIKSSHSLFFGSLAGEGAVRRQMPADSWAPRQRALRYR